MNVKIQVDGKFIDLTSDVNFRIFKQFYDFRNVKSTQGDYTLNLSIPQTKNNINILQFVPDLQNKDNLFSKGLNAKIIANERVLMEGSLIIDSWSKEVINVSIIGNTFEWATELSKFSLNNLTTFNKIKYTGTSNIWLQDAEEVNITDFNNNTWVNSNNEVQFPVFSYNNFFIPPVYRISNIIVNSATVGLYSVTQPYTNTAVLSNVTGSGLFLITLTQSPVLNEWYIHKPPAFSYTVVPTNNLLGNQLSIVDGGYFYSLKQDGIDTLTLDGIVYFDNYFGDNFNVTINFELVPQNELYDKAIYPLAFDRLPPAISYYKTIEKCFEQVGYSTNTLLSNQNIKTGLIDKMLIPFSGDSAPWNWARLTRCSMKIDGNTHITNGGSDSDNITTFSNFQTEPVIYTSNIFQGYNFNPSIPNVNQRIIVEKDYNFALTKDPIKNDLFYRVNKEGRYSINFQGVIDRYITMSQISGVGTILKNFKVFIFKTKDIASFRNQSGPYDLNLNLTNPSFSIAESNIFSRNIDDIVAPTTVKSFSSPCNFNVSTTIDLEEGDYIGVDIALDVSAIISGSPIYNIINFILSDFSFDVTMIEDETKGNILDLNPALFLPNITASDFINQYIKQFNLFYETDVDNKIVTFYDYDSYFFDGNNSIDWTHQCTTEDAVVRELLTFNKVKFTYNNEGSLLQTDVTKNNLEFTSNLTSTQKNEFEINLIWIPSIDRSFTSIIVDNSNLTFNLPYFGDLSKLTEINSGVQLSYNVGNRLVVKKAFDENTSPFMYIQRGYLFLDFRDRLNLNGGENNNNPLLFRSVMLSSTGTPIDQFGNTNIRSNIEPFQKTSVFEFDIIPSSFITPDTYSLFWNEFNNKQGLYQLFYEDYIDLLNNSILVTIPIKLDNIDITNFTPRIPVQIRNQIYLVNKIDGFNPNEDSLTKVQLIKKI